MFETITTIVTIGKSKKEIAYTFLNSDFIRIEGDELILKNEDRNIKIVEDQIKSVILHMNGELK